MMEKSLVNTGSLQNRIVNLLETSSNRDFTTFISTYPMIQGIG